MSYSLAVSPPAAAQIDTFPQPLARFVREQLNLLTQNPTALSKPTAILQPRGQLFEIHYEAGGVSVWVSIIFRFGQDEQTLHVEHVVAEFG